jgi:hypothetical protein
MNFLKKIGISNNTVKEMLKTYEPEVINNAMLDEKKIVEVIFFLKKNGLTNIDGLLLYNLPFLFLGKEKIKKLLEKDGSIKEAIEKINSDIKYVDKLLNK